MSPETKNLLVKITQDILGYLGYSDASSIVAHEEGASLVIAVSSEDKMGLLIGKNGQNIRAIEHLIKAITFKKLNRGRSEEKTNEHFNFSLDINDYKKLRSGYVLKLAKDVAQKVSQTRRSEAMLPMNSYERRLIHTELASFKEIETESIGEEPRRRIVIKPSVEI